MSSPIYKNVGVNGAALNWSGLASKEGEHPPVPMQSHTQDLKDPFGRFDRPLSWLFGSFDS
jgi:hypothetical protein